MDPKSDGGQPGGEAAMKPEAAPKAAEEMKATPEGGDTQQKSKKSCRKRTN